MNSNMANIPTVNGTDSPEMNHSVFNPSQAQVGSSTSTVPQGFNIIPLASQPLVPFAWTSNANYIDRMTEVAARRFQCQQQQQMNEMGLLPAIANRLPIYIPATALGGIPVYDIQTIIGRHFMDCRQNPDTINPVVQAPMIHNTVTLPGRRMYERIKSCPDTVRLVTGYESQGTVIPYKAVQNAYFQDSTQHVPPHNVFVAPGPAQQLLGNHVLGGCRESVGNAQISSTVTTITECRYDSADHRPDTLIPCSKTEYCKDFPSLFKNVPGEADTFEVTVSPTERLPQVQQTSNPDQTPLQFGEMQDKPLENGVHSNAMSSCVQQSHTSPSLFAKPSESVEASGPNQDPVKSPSPSLFPKSSESVESLKPNQDPVMSSSPSLVAKPSESVEALKPNQDPVMSSSPSLVAKPSESVEALKPNQDPVMSSSPSLVAKPSESVEALKPNQDPVMSSSPSLVAKPSESVEALKPNQDPVMSSLLSLFPKSSESVEALKPNQDPVMSSSPSLVAKPSESVEALKPNQDPVMSSLLSLFPKSSESVEALKPNQDPVMSLSPSLVAKPSESAEALKPNQDPVMSLLPSLFAKPRESVSALKPNQDPLMPKHENGAKEGERFSEKRSESKSERTRPKIVTEVKMPEYSPSKSYNFIKSILCEDVGQRFQADPSKKKEYKLTRTESATELPFSILTIREQRDYLKRTEDAFVQDAPCYDIARMYGVETSGPLLSTNSWRKCRECRSAKQKESLAVFCRFYGFRKLRFQDNLLCTAGFLYPEDCVEKDLQLWLPQKQCFWEKSKDTKDVLSPNDPLDQTMCDFILLNIEKMFCDIVIRERKALTWVEKKEMIRWKKPVAGVREMCDVCETTLFNMHWICRVCGYGVCLDCYERRMSKSISDQEFYDGDKSNCFRWARCTKGKNHFHFSMVPTQIIPSTCLLDLSDMVHSICAARSIKTFCPCQKEVTSSKICAKLDKRCDHRLPSGKSSGTKGSEVNNSKNRKRKNSNSSSDPQTSADSCRPKSKESKLTSPSENMDLAKQPTVCLVDLLSKESWENNADVAKDSAQQRNWLCEGKLLQLTDSQHPNNIDIFKLHWKFGMPVLVSGVGKYLNMELWLPNQLSREYGDANSKNSLVNCITGSIVTNMKIRDFWDGFENISQRLLDENKKTMILKLKDWPPTESFHDVMPEVYEDLMRALPLPEYTFINGKCNLASRLPHFFVKPDLGPKMYNAYGWVTEKNWKQGTTNLHLDVSDAVNIMVYVGIPMDEPPEARNTLLEIISEGEVDDIQYKRALVDKPGALWHIFHVNDVDKIRKFIRQVCAERGETLAADHDPIHDQQMYLDKELRNRLKQEYNVEGYAILQCQGDGVFIPAGAPHQVFNLHSCIKIAEDFVSPEHVDKCFALTNEFRYLSSTHSNHEDKLQIKNIIYHSVKDIVSSAMHAHCA